MRKFLTIFILFSILIHLSGYWGSYSIPISNPFPNKNPQSIEVNLIETDEPEDKDSSLQAPIRFSEAPKELIDDSLEKLKQKVDLLSEKVQRVKKETRAKLFGLTKNRWNQPKLKSNSNTESNSKSKSDDNSIASSNLDNENGIIDPRINNSSHNQYQRSNEIESGVSTFGNQLNKNVELGDFTALNTDRHLYYSFYSRIEEMIRPSWENDAYEESRRVLASNPLRPKGGWTSRIDVILNSDGKLVRISLLKGSGIKGFDNAAITAFQKAGFFPHPPKGIINEEGLIVLKYLFTVY